MRGRPDLDMVAEGDAVLKRGDLKLSADLLSYDQVQDLALARGNVVIVQEGNRYTGPELQLKVQRFEGFFLNPTYYFGRTAAGGKAERIDFIDSQRTVATKATYSSCPADGSNDPDWLLSSDSVRMDFDNNEGIAEGGVLRFLGVPILAAPRLSFPLTDERKSGWLPPSFAIDNRSGVLLAHALVLEHRAQPRRHLHAIGERAARLRTRQRVPLPRALLPRRADGQRDALRPRRRTLALFVRRAAPVQRGRRASGQAADPACVGQQLLERLPARPAQPDPPAAAFEPPGDPAVRRLVHVLQRPELAGAAERRQSVRDAVPAAAADRCAHGAAVRRRFRSWLRR